MPMPKKPRPPCRQCGEPVKRASYTYCSNQCQKDFEYHEYIKRWLAGEESGNRAEQVSNHVRRYLMELHGEKCQECGWGKRNPTTGMVPLQVEHVDGDPLNTTPENVKLICPNCHALTPTFGNLNKGNGRTRRRAVRRGNAGVAQR